MARHFRFPTYLGPNDNEVIEGWEDDTPTPLELGTYVGFMIGPDSDHDVVKVVAGTDTFHLAAGAVVPVDMFTGVPTVQCVRSLDARNAVGTPIRSVLHVIGLTCVEELACKPRRPPIRREYIQPGPGAAAFIIPLCRRHTLLHITLSAPGTLILEGYDPLGGTIELLNVALAAGNHAYDIGGTDHEELWPALRVDCSVYSTVTVWQAGEVGG